MGGPREGWEPAPWDVASVSGGVTPQGPGAAAAACYLTQLLHVCRLSVCRADITIDLA